MTLPLADTLPNSNDGYVAAAYIVFFAIVLIYVAIMAVRLGRVERRLQELRSEPGVARAQARAGESGPAGDVSSEEPFARARESGQNGTALPRDGASAAPVNASAPVADAPERETV